MDQSVPEVNNQVSTPEIATNQNASNQKSSLKIIIVFIGIAITIMVAALVLVSKQRLENIPVTTTQNPKVNPSPTQKAGALENTLTTNEQLNKDIQSVDTSLNSLDDNMAGVDEGLNDKTLDLTE